MTHHHDTDALIREFSEQPEDLAGGGRVQGSGRLIGEQNSSIPRHGARDTHPLPLPAGHLRRPPVPHRLQAHALQPGVGVFHSRRGRPPTRS